MWVERTRCWVEWERVWMDVDSCRRWWAAKAPQKSSAAEGGNDTIAWIFMPEFEVSY
jgi:hypothetical protein